MDNNIIENFYGITLYASSNNILRDNLIQNDTHCGIYMSKSSNNKILNNSIKNNVYNGIGVYDYSNSNVIQNNSLTQNNYCGVNIRISSNNIIIGNNLSENNIGIHLPDSENMFYDNVLYNNKLDVEREFFLIRTEFILLMVVVSIALGLVVYFLFWKKKNLSK
jgi:parallel beta-helix repeat protein